MSVLLQVIDSDADAKKYFDAELSGVLTGYSSYKDGTVSYKVTKDGKEVTSSWLDDGTYTIEVIHGDYFDTWSDDTSLDSVILFAFNQFDASGNMAQIKTSDYFAGNIREVGSEPMKSPNYSTESASYTFDVENGLPKQLNCLAADSDGTWFESGKTIKGHGKNNCVILLGFYGTLGMNLLTKNDKYTVSIDPSKITGFDTKSNPTLATVKGSFNIWDVPMTLVLAGKSGAKFTANPTAHINVKHGDTVTCDMDYAPYPTSIDVSKPLAQLTIGRYIVPQTYKPVLSTGGSAMKIQAATVTLTAAYKEASGGESGGDTPTPPKPPANPDKNLHIVNGYVIDAENLDKVAKYNYEIVSSGAVSDVDLTKYFVNLYALWGLPKDIIGANQPVYLGKFNTKATAKNLNSTEMTIDCGDIVVPNDPSITGVDVFLPFAGFTRVENAIGQTVHISYSCNLYSGDGVYSLSMGGTVFDIVKARCGYDMPFRMTTGVVTRYTTDVTYLTGLVVYAIIRYRSKGVDLSGIDATKEELNQLETELNEGVIL